MSLNQLQEYYIINKKQASSSFNFSILFISIGFIILLIGIGFIYLNTEHVTLATITSIAGIVSEFIGAAYFFMYKKSIEQLNHFLVS